MLSVSGGTIMKLNLGKIGKLAVAGGLAIASLTTAIPQKAFSQSNNFYYREVQGRHITFIKLPDGAVPFIEWDSTYFEDSDYTPKVRATQVTNRLNYFFNQSSGEVYLNHGIMNRQKILCVADYKGGPCTGLLYTLKPLQDPEQVMFKLARQLDNPTNYTPIREALCKTYINLSAVIRGETDFVSRGCSEEELN